MSARRDPTMIGTDEYGNSVSLIYNCNNGYCSEIHSLTCERRCNEKVFNTTGKNTFIFDGERVIIARLDCHVNNSCCKILLYKIHCSLICLRVLIIVFMP